MTSIGIALTLSLLAILVWILFATRVLFNLAIHHERRIVLVAVAIIGILASAGTLATAVGRAILAGELSIAIDPQAIILTAAMGRGALLMGGLLALTHYRPVDGRRRPR